MKPNYRGWLESQEYSSNTVNTQCSHISRIEQSYKNIDELYMEDGLAGLAASLRYTTDDTRRGSPNPSKLPIGGDLYKALASFRTAVNLYARFRTETAGESLLADQATLQNRVVDEVGRERIGLERDLQKALRREIAQLDKGLTIIDEGVERAVPSGFIDITARDESGSIVVIELKAGIADRSAIGQILSYMGDVSEDEESAEVRGILVAHGFDAKARSAARMIPNLALRSYAVRFLFGDPLAVPEA